MLILAYTYVAIVINISNLNPASNIILAVLEGYPKTVS